jgi:HK97 family phage major capsid protein
MSATNTAPTVADVIKSVGDLGKQIEALPKAADLETLRTDVKAAHTELNDLKAKVSEIKVKDFGDDLGLGKRYSSLRHCKSDKEAYGFGALFLAGIAAEMPQKVKNAGAAQKALEYAKTNGIILTEKAALNEGTNTVGGYLVNEQFSNRMVDLREQYGVGRGLMASEPMTSDTLSFNRRTGGLTVYPLGESTSITESGLTFDRIGLVAKKWGTYTLLTSELNEDSMISLGDRLAGEIAYAFASNEDDCIFNGDGSATYQGIEGIRPKLKTINGTDEGGGLILQTSNAFADITLTDFHELIGILPQYADGPNTKFVCHRTFWSQVMCRLQYAAGGVSKADIASAGDKTFLGYPVVISQKYPSSDTASVVYCTFGDHSLAGTFGNRRATTIAFSVDFKFQTDEIAVRSTTRWDAVWHDLGTATAAGPVVGLMSSAS